MKTYISILRGINVSGQKKIKMTGLVNLYEGIGLREVIPYIQSGNVIFDSDHDVSISELSQKIESAIFKKYGFQVPVIIRTVDEMKAILRSNPFLKGEGEVTAKLYITFLEDIPQQADIDKVNHFNFSPDRFIIINREVYLDCAGGYGTTRLSNTFFENKLRVRATTRNWNTVNKLVELATKA